MYQQSHGRASLPGLWRNGRSKLDQLHFLSTCLPHELYPACSCQGNVHTWRDTCSFSKCALHRKLYLFMQLFSRLEAPWLVPSKRLPLLCLCPALETRPTPTPRSRPSLDTISSWSRARSDHQSWSPSSL